MVLSIDTRSLEQDILTMDYEWGNPLLLTHELSDVPW